MRYEQLYFEGMAPRGEWLEALRAAVEDAMSPADYSDLESRIFSAYDEPWSTAEITVPFVAGLPETSIQPVSIGIADIPPRRQRERSRRRPENQHRVRGARTGRQRR